MIGILQSLGITLVSYLLVLTLVVTVHEFGHFIAAKACGVAIERFSIGFGKAIASWRDRSGVEWRIGWIPFGGYVRFAGDENAASVPDHDDLETMRRDIVKREGPEALARYYHFKPVWQRAIVAAAGPAANFLLAVVIFAGFLMVLGRLVVTPQVATVVPGSPAAIAGFQPGDFIEQANGRPVLSFEEVAQVALFRVNLPTPFVVRRHGADVALTVTPELRSHKDDQGHIVRQPMFGIERVQGPNAVYHKAYGPLEATVSGAQRTWYILTDTIHYLGRMITGQVPANQISGPLGIARISGEVAHNSIEVSPDFGMMILNIGLGLLELAALISVSIGFLNLLPIPVLDGGHLLFYAYEALARRPLAAKVQAAGYRLGLALVLGLLLFGTWNDLQQLSVLKILGGS